MNRKQALREFIDKKKFLSDGLYPGAVIEADRLRFESLINQLATSLIELAEVQNPEALMLNRIKVTNEEFEYLDTEDREQGFRYFEQLLAIFKIEDANKKLRISLDGFDILQPEPDQNGHALAAMSAEERGLARKLDKLKLETAVPFLTARYGPPSADTKEAKMWIGKGHSSDAIGITYQGNQPILTWVAKGRFVYIKKF